MTPSNDLDRRFLLGGLAGAAGITALAAMSRTAAAGPLNPPPGPVASTPGPEARTPISSAPFTINTPGSYYLATNLTIAGGAAITVSATGVTIDLNGFSITGTGPSDGILLVNGGNAVTITNGSIRGAAAAVRSNGVAAGNDVTLSHLRIDGITGNSTISLAGRAVIAGTIITNCQGGVTVGQHSSIADTIAESISATAFTLGDFSRIDRCTARNTADRGFIAGAGCTIVDCRAITTSANGFQTGIDCALLGCAALHCGASGFILGGGNTITDSTAADIAGNYGIDTGANSAAVRCTVRGRGSVAGPNLSGINIGSRTAASHCRVIDVVGPPCFSIRGANARMEDCSGHSSGAGAGGGVSIASSSAWSIERCSFEGITGPGVYVQSSPNGSLRHCVIRHLDNGASSTSPGILIDSSSYHTVVQNNTLGNLANTTVGRAIALDAGFCTVTSNTFSGYTTAISAVNGSAYNPNNAVGPVVGPATIGSTVAWANTMVS